MDKSPDAFRTISEVADSLDTPAHVLRFWESRFPQIKPVKRAGGRRYYRPSDVALLTGIKRLLHDEGLTIRGVQKILRDHGVRHVAGLTDDSVSIDELMLPDVALPNPDINAGGAAPEAGFVDIDDTEAEAEQVTSPVPDRVQSPQFGLTLFDTPPALSRVEPAATAARVVGKVPTLRHDTTFSTMIRALPRGSLRSHRSQLADLAGQLAALRARLSERAEGNGS